MGRRRSKWKDQPKDADSGSLLLRLAKTGACSDLEQLLRSASECTTESDRVQFLQRTQDHMGSTALHLAASEGHCDMIALLLRLGAGEIHLSGGRKKYAKTPLHEAAMCGHLDACRLLVASGFLVDCHTTRGRTPLMYAVKGDFLDVAAYFLHECHANVNEQNEMGVTPVYIASQDGHEAMVRLLVEAGADVNICNRTKHAPLHEAVAGGHVAIAAYLMDHGADKQVVDAMGVTIWHEAAGHGSVAMLELLVQYQVSLHPGNGPDQVDKVMARHPFHYAAVEGQTAFIQAMLDHSLVDVNLVDADNCTAIYYAAANGHADVLRVLLQAKGDPAVCSIRRSPLHCAVEWRRLDCVRLLLQYGGASLTQIKDKNALLPLDVANQMADAQELCSVLTQAVP